MSTEYHDLAQSLKPAEPAPEPEVVADPTPEPVADQVATPEPEVDEDQALADDESTEPTEPEPVKRDKAAEKRIAKLVKEREQLKGQLALYQSQGEQPIQAQSLEIDPALPDPNHYPEGVNDLDYRLDVRDYQREQVRKAQSFQSKLQEAVTKYPDLQDLIEADQSRTNPTMAALVQESEVGVDLFHFLMSNPDVANKIASMGPTATAKEIGRIEAKLEEKAKATTPATVKKTVTPPPAPITPVKSSKAAAQTSRPALRYTVY